MAYYSNSDYLGIRTIEPLSSFSSTQLSTRTYVIIVTFPVQMIHFNFLASSFIYLSSFIVIKIQTFIFFTLIRDNK